MRQSIVDIAGQKLRLMEEGEGETVLFLHGAGGLNWYPLLQRLSRRRRVIAPEHPSWGRSAVPEWLTSVGDLAFFYLDLIERLDLRGVHLVGHSMGGWTAAELAIRSTARLASLSLMAPAGVAAPDTPFGDIFHWSPEEHARRSFHDQAFAEARIRKLPESDPELMRRNRAAAARLGREPLLVNPQLRYWLHRIDVPALLVWGVEDQICPFACRRDYLASIAGVELFALPRTGHALHTEGAQAVSDRLDAFFDAAAGRRYSAAVSDRTESA